ncbi:bifunctional UDP-N-acetylglucosamine diphosphorylase/glucosamine-1-phosphate N-acetyltransferase GlmU [Radiobacillus sp. PE A8.2]|uniref:bifunctional UDP-N-acetylglucosamine diphosphorylase/glucosamine-1-phosphate N-acetyltransferase GlmU n=1 Tax=Radiobacillus sp. PE A8.2 TaxID=3380349 RepID=UPI00388E912B
MSNNYAIILAAGKGTRMKSNLYKVLHLVCGKPMIQHVVDQVTALNFDQVITVVGHGADVVKETLGDQVSYKVQAEQLGTGHAVQQAEDLLFDKEGTTLVICGDTPLIRTETIDALLQFHEQEHAKATILTTHTEQPTGYGRIIRHDAGHVERIVEEKDANAQEKAVQEINTGTYCFDNKALFAALASVNNHNTQGEYYLPDVIEILQKQGEIVAAYQTLDFDETLGVNDRIALSKAEAIMKKRVNQAHMKNGVTLIDPEQTYISAGTVIGQDTVIYPGTMLTGEVTIGEACTIGPNTEIKDSVIGNETVVRQSVIFDSEVGNSVNIGPFAHIRPSSVLGDNTKIGNFVEVKKAKFGAGSKASHLSYIGDADIGSNVNLGCGSITVNYDGTNKHVTKVGDNAFVGCNANLIAPVTIGEGGYVAAGSTITDDIPNDSLSIARARQVNKDGYMARNK